MINTYRREIRESFYAGTVPWEILTTLVKDGIEFPEAVDMVASALNMDDEALAEMVDAYDNNC